LAYNTPTTPLSRNLKDETMSQDIEFPEFPYFSVKYVHPNHTSLGHLLYPSIIERFFSRIDLISNPGPLPARFGECRVYQDPKITTIYSTHNGPIASRQTLPTLSHKFRGSISPRIVALALARPEYVVRLLQRRRLPRMGWANTCGNPVCVHPLHLRCLQDPRWAGGVLQPRERSRTRRTSEWLTLPEVRWLQYKMMTAFTHEPADVISQFSTLVGMDFSTVVEVWNTLVARDRIYWFEHFVVKGEHRL
jgi:hypothetical protein